VYVDPGLGALIVQGFVGAVIGTVYVARQRIANLWRRLFARRPAGE
jgi:hypothetical protein